jgi:heme/copper-type cytochrome/quinol oxidase subunit 4
MFARMLFRMLAGGFFVSVFALLSDTLKPKRFAGLFGAAPSVALTTLALTAATKGRLYASTEARSMLGGAIVFAIYSYGVFQLMLKSKLSAWTSTLLLIPLWIVSALGIWLVCFR